MCAALASGVPTVNGYSGSHPPGWELEQSVIHTPADERRIWEQLGRWVALHHLDPSRICWVRLTPLAQLRDE